MLCVLPSHRLRFLGCLADYPIFTGLSDRSMYNTEIVELLIFGHTFVMKTSWRGLNPQPLVLKTTALTTMPIQRTKAD